MKKLLFKAPVLTASGYGVHSRQLLSGLVKSGAFDIYVAPIGWGQTPFIFEDTEETRLIRALSIKREELERSNSARYDVSVQVTIPNEFEKIGAINIGVTAGIEVDRVSPDWISKTNDNVDAVVVPSRHSMSTFAGPVYRSYDGRELRLARPLAISAEGVDTSIFNTEELPPSAFEWLRLGQKFNFLSVGLGLDRNMGEDRKNISKLIKLFCERFAGDEDVGLVLKIGLVNNSIVDLEMTKKRISEIKRSTGCGKWPSITLVHGRLSEMQLASLYKHPGIKAYVTLTHGEGFGLPILEAAACGLPIVATDWSGHLDFLKIGDKSRFVPVEHKLERIPQSAVWKGVMEDGTNWAVVSDDDAKLKMKKVVLSYDRPKEWATELAEHVAKNYSIDKTSGDFAKFVVDFVEKNQRPTSMKEAAEMLRKQIGIDSTKKTMLYTMPMSAGDVHISTGVVSSLRKKHPGYVVYFATDKKYFDLVRDVDGIDFVMPWADWMANVPLCEMVFDEVYTPNLAIQMNTSNWLRGGHGRKLAEEMAAQCQVEFSRPSITREKFDVTPFVGDTKYVVLNTGSGKGQWEARNYLSWKTVTKNITKLAGVPVIQVGEEDNPQIDGCVDLRGKTKNYNQLADVIAGASLVVSIDSLSMHLAATFDVPVVAIFGSSYARSTGPVSFEELGGSNRLIETRDRMGCTKACYKHQCMVDRDRPCINNIDPKMIVKASLDILKTGDIESYEEYAPTIWGYTHVLNAEERGYPYVESITSMLGFCDHVVVVDGGSTDGTYEKIESLKDDRITLIKREWDWDEPGMDGMQKAFARAMCQGEFLWQQDADEVVHEEDYEKIKKMAKDFPSTCDLVHLPVVELWGDGETVRTDRHSWKWRMSRNDYRITHGINKDARVFDAENGRTYAKKGMSDGCEYVDVMSGEFVSHRGFYTNDLENLRKNDPEKYGAAMNEIFNKFPSVYHYSWADLKRKVKNFRDFWDKCWSNLYKDEKPEQRFPDGSVDEIAKKLKEQGGEHGPAATYKLGRSNPAIMKGWLDAAAR